MKQLVLAVSLLVLPALGFAEDMWRWKDPSGKVHYSNIPGVPPDAATRVQTRITIEADRLPGTAASPDLRLVEGHVVDGDVVARDDEPAPRRSKAAARKSRWLPDAPRIYDEA